MARIAKAAIGAALLVFGSAPAAVAQETPLGSDSTLHVTQVARGEYYNPTPRTPSAAIRPATDGMVVLSVRVAGPPEMLLGLDWRRLYVTAGEARYDAVSVRSLSTTHITLSPTGDPIRTPAGRAADFMFVVPRDVAEFELHLPDRAIGIRADSPVRDRIPD